MGTKHRGKRMFYYKYFTLNKMKEVHIMSKKILKRSLALGALMAFVITGSAWAEEPTHNKYYFPNKMMFNSGHYYPNIKEATNENLSNIVFINDENYIAGGTIMIYASFVRTGVDRSNKTVTGNILDISKNLTVNANLELFGCSLNNNSYGFKEAKSNLVKIIGTDVDNPIIIRTIYSGYILIAGGMTNEMVPGYTACENMVEIDKVCFFSGEDDATENAKVTIMGGQGRTGHAINNEVVIKNTIIADGSIYGGVSEDRKNSSGSYNATENTVTIDKGAAIGESVIVAGGYVYNGSIGNADGNTVTIKGNSIVAGKVYGGYSEHGIANNNTINIKENADVSKARLFGDKDGAGKDNTLNIEHAWSGKVGSAQNFDVINVYEGSEVAFVTALNDSGTTVNLDSATWNITPEEDGDSQTNKVGALNSNDGRIVFNNNGHLDVHKVGSGEVIITEAGKTADNLNTASQLTTVAAKMGVSESAKESAKAKVVMEAGEVVGKTTGIVAFETKGSGDDTYYHGVVTKVTEEINPANEAISDTGVSMKLHWRAHVDDMNKRMGELRDANGEHGVWTRMVRGESEYKNTKAQYNQYQLGYDEKLSVDKRWTVGAAVTFSDGKADYGYGSTEDKSTAFAIYGSKLNNDGTFVDLIARYAHLESDVEDQAGKGSYSANGMSVSAEVGKRIQQDNGLWIEPQVQLTYGTVDSAEYKIGNKTVEVGDMNSLIGRVGFRIGKDIEKGNFYARASYLYDFEGETQNAFRNDTARRTFAEDLGGGWWEVGVGANINLSKATYIYADVEKTFGGEVDTNWQWNLGVRYSF